MFIQREDFVIFQNLVILRLSAQSDQIRVTSLTPPSVKEEASDAVVPMNSDLELSPDFTHFFPLLFLVTSYM